MSYGYNNGYYGLQTVGAFMQGAQRAYNRNLLLMADITKYTHQVTAQKEQKAYQRGRDKIADERYEEQSEHQRNIQSANIALKIGDQLANIDASDAEITSTIPRLAKTKDGKYTTDAQVVYDTLMQRKAANDRKRQTLYAIGKKLSPDMEFGLPEASGEGFRSSTEALPSILDGPPDEAANLGFTIGGQPEGHGYTADGREWVLGPDGNKYFTKNGLMTRDQYIPVEGNQKEINEQRERVETEVGSEAVGDVYGLGREYQKKNDKQALTQGIETMIANDFNKIDPRLNSIEQIGQVDPSVISDYREKVEDMIANTDKYNQATKKVVLDTFRSVINGGAMKNLPSEQAGRLNEQKLAQTTLKAYRPKQTIGNAIQRLLQRAARGYSKVTADSTRLGFVPANLLTGGGATKLARIGADKVFPDSQKIRLTNEQGEKVKRDTINAMRRELVNSKDWPGKVKSYLAEINPGQYDGNTDTSDSADYLQAEILAIRDIASTVDAYMDRYFIVEKEGQADWPEKTMGVVKDLGKEAKEQMTTPPRKPLINNNPYFHSMFK